MEEHGDEAIPYYKLKNRRTGVFPVISTFLPLIEGGGLRWG